MIDHESICSLFYKYTRRIEFKNKTDSFQLLIINHGNSSFSSGRFCDYAIIDFKLHNFQKLPEKK